jgi:predicted branched-subunit amino acid permease
MIGATLVQWPSWVGGTVIGVIGGGVLGDPMALGLDAMFVAFYLALLFEEARGRAALTAAVLGAGIALLLMLASGIVPAVRAARLPVVAALRNVE